MRIVERSAEDAGGYHCLIHSPSTMEKIVQSANEISTDEKEVEQASPPTESETPVRQRRKARTPDLGPRQLRAKATVLDIRSRYDRGDVVILNICFNVKRVLLSQAKQRTNIRICVFDVSPHREFFFLEKMQAFLAEVREEGTLVSYDPTPLHEFNVPLTRYRPGRTTPWTGRKMTIDDLISNPDAPVDREKDFIVSGRLYQVVANPDALRASDSAVVDEQDPEANPPMEPPSVEQSN